MGLYHRRVLANRIVLGLSFAATASGIVVLGLVLGSLLIGGVGAIGPAIFTQMTPPPGNSGGLLDRDIGRMFMVGAAPATRPPGRNLSGPDLAPHGLGHLGRGNLRPC